MNAKIPLYVITGFLGSGKTTLINKLISEKINFKPAIIVNEFGEIGLDHKLIQKSDDDLILLNNGCLCCLLQSNLINTLHDLLLKKSRNPDYNFDSIVIETSGIADPGSIIQNLMIDETVQNYFQFKKLITVVDSDSDIEKMALDHAIYTQQILFADDIYISKLNKNANSMKKEKILNFLKETNPTAKIHTEAELNLFNDDYSENIEEYAQNEPRSYSSKMQKHQSYFTSTVSYNKEISLNKLMKFLEAIIVVTSPNILRIKGFVTLEGTNNTYVINCVQNYLEEPYLYNQVRSESESKCQMTFIMNKDQREFITNACNYVWG